MLLALAVTQNPAARAVYEWNRGLHLAVTIAGLLDLHFDLPGAAGDR